MQFETEIDTLYYSFDPRDSLAAAWLNATVAEYMQRFIHNKLVQVLFTVCTLIWMTLISLNMVYMTEYVIFSAIYAPFMLTYTSGWILSANKKAMNILIRTFEYWIKVGQAMILTFFNYFDYYETMLAVGVDVRYHAFFIVTNVIVTFPVFIIFAAGLDAIKIDRKYQILVTILLSIVYAALALMGQFVYLHDPNFNHIKEFYGLKFSCLDYKIYMWRTLFLFFAKQAFVTYRNRHSGKAVQIKYAPQIEWNMEEESSVERKSRYDSRSIRSIRMSALSALKSGRPSRSIRSIRINASTNRLSLIEVIIDDNEEEYDYDTENEDSRGDA